jgi:hypothetical protein
MPFDLLPAMICQNCNRRTVGLSYVPDPVTSPLISSAAMPAFSAAVID